MDDISAISVLSPTTPSSTMTVEKEGGPGGSGGMNKKPRGGAAAVPPPPIFKDQDSFQFVHRKKDAFEDLCQEKPAGQYAKSRQYHREKDVSKVRMAFNP